jgi:uncharacterized protein (TIGR03086 family)
MAIVTSDADTVMLLERALDQTERLIAAVDEGQAGLPTPCADWDVQALVWHMAGQDLRNFLIALRGETADWRAPAEELGEDWAATFRDRAVPLRALWRSANLDVQFGMSGGGQAPLRARAGQQITELTVHDWDLAIATGQSDGLDPALAEHALNWSRGMLRPEHRGPDKAVGHAVPVAADAPAYQRLAGWFGRDPEWLPPGQ